MGRSPCCSKEGLNRGAWTALEDKILTTFIKIHGEGKWRNLPKRAGLKRCGKSCRLRWLNYLRPDIKRGNISGDEEELIIRLHKLLGNRWSLIAGRLPGRTDNEIKNYWNTTLGKKIGAQSSTSNPSERGSQINKSKANKKSAARRDQLNPTEQDTSPTPQPIRTKAFRCTKVLTSTLTTLSPSPPSTYDPNHHLDLKATNLHQSQQTYLTSPRRNSDNSLMDIGNDFLNFGCDEVQGNLCMGNSDNSLLFDKPMLEEWSRSYGHDDVNGTMDLGSFGFLLDCEGWP